MKNLKIFLTIFLLMFSFGFYSSTEAVDYSVTDSVTVTVILPSITHTLTITKSGTGSGSTTGAGSYDEGKVVIATATPDATSTFSGWSGDCDATGKVTMTSDKTCNASFTKSACAEPTNQTVKTMCPAKDGFTLVSGEVTRSQTKTLPSCTFGTPVTIGNSTYVSDNCVYVENVISCPEPTSQTVKVACDAKDGFTLVSGEVTRSQIKVAPSCMFGTPITVDNSTYVSDNCVYKENIINCPEPTTQTLKVACDLKDGEMAISGEVTRRQTKTLPSCTFGIPMTVGNSTYVSDNCVYPSTNPLGGGDGDGGGDGGVVTDPIVVIPGAWSLWSPRSGCPNSDGTQTRTCNGGNCVADFYGQATEMPYTVDQCPVVTIGDIKDKNGVIVKNNLKIPYNTNVKIDWSTKNTNTCTCSYTDSNHLTSTSCPLIPDFKKPYTTPFLQRDTKYEIICTDDYDSTASATATILVDKIKTEVIEQ